MTERIPPQNLEAEQAALGSCLIEPSAIDAVAETLQPGHFYRDAHRAIYEAILALRQQNQPVDMLSVMETIQRNPGMGEQVGGLQYLHCLMDAPSTAVNAPYYAGVVVDKAMLRRLLDVSTLLQTLAWSDYGEGRDFESVDAILDMAEQSVLGVRQGKASGTWQSLSSLLSDRLDEMERRCDAGGRVAGVSSGFADLDYMLAGLHPSDLVILAARPAMGKTALAMQIASSVALKGQPVAVLSLEMSAEQLTDRLICSEARVDSHRARTGFLTAEDWEAIGAAASRLHAATLWIEDIGSVGIADIRAHCRRLKAERGLALVVVDYLQLLRSTQPFNRNQEIGSIARGLKEMAREFEVPVIALAQLSRAVEQRPDKRPLLSDLRDSGEIEAHADTVLFLYRDAYYKRGIADDGEPMEPGAETIETAEIIIAKQRNGPTGTVKVGFLPTYGRFETLAQDSRPAQAPPPAPRPEPRRPRPAAPPRERAQPPQPSGPVGPDIASFMGSPFDDEEDD